MNDRYRMIWVGVEMGYAPKRPIIMGKKTITINLWLSRFTPDFKHTPL
jgi:hypothetical protein